MVIFLACRYILRIARSSLTMNVTHRVKIKVPVYHCTILCNFSITVVYANKYGNARTPAGMGDRVRVQFPVPDIYLGM